MRARRSSLFGGLAVVLAACSAAATPAATTNPARSAPGSPASSSATLGPSVAGAPPARLGIYAAGSLSASMRGVKSAYEAANPGTTVTVSTDSSTALATKIEQGAPADILLSADMTNPGRLVDGGIALGPVTIFARNLLAIIVPAANRAGISDPSGLARARVKIITCADSVPIARYTQTLIANLARQPGYPADYAAAYAANIASKEASVTAIVTKIELGEGDAGIVYVTDARASSKVRPIEIPDRANVLAGYGGVVVKASPNVAAAEAFLAWLTGAGGQAVLADFGFLAPA